MKDRPLRVRFCGNCGRMILLGFEFCPYCGSPVRPGPEGQDFRPGTELSARQVFPPSAAPDPGSPRGAPSIPRDAREARLLLDRLIRELEVLDAEMEEWAVNGER